MRKYVFNIDCQPKTKTLTTLFFVLLSIAIIVNLFQFHAIDEETRHNYSAWHLYDSINLFEVAIRRDTSSRQLVAPFWLIGREFPDSTFVLPMRNRRSWFEIDLSLIAFGNARSIHYADYDSVDIFDSEKFESKRFSIEEYLAPRGGTHRRISERVGVYVSDSFSGIFVVSTPQGNPGRRDRLEFVDLFLLTENRGFEVRD